jgi:hypothetical protein
MENYYYICIMKKDTHVCTMNVCMYMYNEQLIKIINYLCVSINKSAYMCINIK